MFYCQFLSNRLMSTISVTRIPRNDPTRWLDELAAHRSHQQFNLLSIHSASIRYLRRLTSLLIVATTQNGAIVDETVQPVLSDCPRNIRNFILGHGDKLTAKTMLQKIRKRAPMPKFNSYDEGRIFTKISKQPCTGHQDKNSTTLRHSRGRKVKSNKSKRDEV
ncbi:Uncharacterised protein r2_g1990 [Pycnogonum litorale]